MESIIAPVDIFIYYKQLRFGDEWSYQVKMDFNFTDGSDRDSIKGFLLVENGVYTFKSENHAKIEAKRMGAQMKEYFVEKLGPLITDVYNEVL